MWQRIYLESKNFKCKNKLVDKLVAECTENIDEVKIAELTLTECNSVENLHKCSSFILYIVLFSITFTINIGISTYFVYYKYRNRKKENVSRLIMSIKQQIININGKY